MAGVQTTTEYNDLVNLIELEMLKYKFQLPTQMRASGMFKQKPKPDATGDTIRFEEIDGEQYAFYKAQGDSAAKYKTVIGYYIDATLLRTGFNVEVTYEKWKYDKYATTTWAVSRAMDSHANRLDLDLQHRITFATSTSYVTMEGLTVNIATGDGLALASTAHTVTGSTATYRNILANNPQLSKGSLEGMEKMWVENSINLFGQKIGVDPSILWTTDDPNTCNTAMELLKSTAGVLAPNSGVDNVYQGKYKHIAFKRIATDASGAKDATKAKYWGLVATGSGTEGWQAYYAVNEEPHMMPMDEGGFYDSDTDIYKFPTRSGYAIAILSGRFFTISLGDGQA